jgi:hypothetical protein
MMQSGKHRPKINKGQKSIIRTRSLGLHDFQVAILLYRLAVLELESIGSMLIVGTLAKMADAVFIPATDASEYREAPLFTPGCRVIRRRYS